jgi:hypothetical protein
MKPQLINLPKITDQRGNLSFIEFSAHLPFEIARTFWTYNVPGGEERDAHAYKTQHEFIVALSGSFDIVIKDAVGNESTYQLNRSYFGLYLPPLTWRVVNNFSTNAFGLHLSSHTYNGQDYIRDFNQFCSWK